MYNLEYLPVALQDMVAIVRYISRELGNPAAADRLATELINAGDSIPKFPYMNPPYTPIRPLKQEDTGTELFHILLGRRRKETDNNRSGGIRKERLRPVT